MSKNYRNKDASHQDHLVVKSFKKLLLKTTLKPVVSQGYIPIWSKRSGKNIIKEFEPVERNCFILPRAGTASLRSILNGIRREKPLLIYEYKNQEGNVVTKLITELTEAELVRSLKKLSLILYSAEDEKKWLHFTEFNEANIILLADQLSEKGRLGRVPLRKLLTKYCSHISRTGEVDWDLDSQLINEHRLSKAEVEDFIVAAKNLKIELKKCGKDREAKDNLIAIMEKQIMDFCEIVNRGSKRTALTQEPSLIDTVSPVEDPELRRQHEFNTSIRSLDLLWAQRQKNAADMDKIYKLEQEIIKETGLSRDEVLTKMMEERRKRKSGR